MPGTVLWEADPATLQFTYVSDNAPAFLGYPMNDWVSAEGFWVERIHPEDREAAVASRRIAATRGEEHEIEYRMLGADGRTVWVRDHADLVTEGGERMLHGMMLDITAGKVAEQRLRAQYAVTRALAESETLAEAAPSILRAICETLDWQLGALWTADNQAGVLVCEEVWRKGEDTARFEALTRELAFPRGVGVPGRVWESGLPVWIPDVVEDSNFPRAPAAVEDGLHTAVGFPISLGGETTGVFEFFSHEIREPDGETLAMLANLGSQVGQFIERKRVQEALRQTEERYRSIFENAVFGAYQTTPDGRFLTANDALARILGYDSSEDLVSSITDIAHQIHVDPGRREEFGRALQEQGVVHNFEAQAYRKDGSIIWISLSARALRDASGALQGFEGILEDVTARRRAEFALSENEFRYRTIFDSAGVSLWEEDFTVARQMVTELRARGVKDLRKYLQQHPEFVEAAIAAVKILDVNEHSLRLFGARDKAELMGSLTDIFLPETRETFLEELLLLDSGERFFESETVVQTLDGRRLHVLFSIAFPTEPSLLNHVLVSRTDITERKLAEERQEFLAEASAILSSSLDYETTLDNVARLVAGRLGDLCSIDLVEGGEVRRVAMAHADPAKHALLDGMEPTYHPHSDRHPVLRVTHSGLSELVNGVTDETLRDSARDARHLKALQALGMKSAMVVPLKVASKVLGTITIITSDPGRTYSKADTGSGRGALTSRRHGYR